MGAITGPQDANKIIWDDLERQHLTGRGRQERQAICVDREGLRNFSDFANYSYRTDCAWSMNGSENISNSWALVPPEPSDLHHEGGALCDTEDNSVRRFARPLPAWLTFTVLFTAVVAPMAGADDAEHAAYEPFPEEDVPSVAQLDSDYSDEVVEEIAPGTQSEVVEPEVLDSSILEEGEYYDNEIIDTDEIFAGEPDGVINAPVLSTADDLGPCLWYTRADFVLWTRSAPKGGILAVDTSEINSLIELSQAIQPLNSINGSYRIEPAARITVARNLGRDYQNRDHSVELVYLGPMDWKSGAAKRSRDRFALFAPLAQGTVGGFNNADVQTFDVESDFNSIELNVRMQRRPSSDRMVLSPDGRWSRQMNSSFVTSMMAGMRYIRATEKFHWDSRIDGADPGIFGGDYDIETENNLIGLHIGTDTYWTMPNLRLGMRTQFGALVNIAESRRRTVINDPVAPITGTFTAGLEDEAAAFIGEMGWSATYQATKKSSFRFSYDFLWMQGVADATRQITFNFDAPPRINFGSNTFYQGFSLGFEHVW